MKMPVVFIGHGSPENMVLQNEFTDSLVKLRSELPRPRAILVISAHWLTEGTRVTAASHPKTIYDFYGFPDELYRLSYPAPGSPEDARFIAGMVKLPPIILDNEWGFDHASWAVLKHMYPKADIPLLEMSLDYSPFNGWNQPSLDYFYNLGKQLAPLREKGVLIMGSGNIVHNLRIIDMDMYAEPYPWAVEFDERVKRDLIERNHRDLLDTRKMDRTASLSVPTLDHYLPMICVTGLQEKDENIEFTYEGFQNRSVSMRCFRFG